jgi:hypothetical protein
MSTLAELITTAQDQLLDDGTLFSTATCTSATRQALRDFNAYAPQNGGEIVEVVSGQKTYELAGGAFPSLVLDILDVLKNDDNGEDDEPLEYDNIFEDNRLYVRLRTAESSGNLLIRYTWPHTVLNLDSATETTFNSDQEQILVDGICAYACITRSIKPVEQINLNQAGQIFNSYERAALRFLSAFRFGLSRYSARAKPVGEKRKTSWLDSDIAFTSSSQAGALKDL